ncbi:ATP-dependent DNA ligase [Crepidotus variabilis]|uniref:DNA ligase n=1 Tax=Crepidotus variabilis TaxID=179855 RepID=A0A9P6EHI9_9AGAR|nr:ATP-dependent DNA ligase [Crepidotus variabilis]
MSKRKNVSSVSPTKSKRAKTDTGQAKLHQFFGPTTTNSKLPQKSSQTQTFIQGSSKPVSVANQSIPADVTVIDVDALDEVEVIVEEISAMSTSRVEPTDLISTSKTSKAVKMSRTIEDVEVDHLVFSPFDVEPLLYEPEKQPGRADKAPYALLTHALVGLSHTKSRIAIQNILTNVLRTIISRYPASLLPAVYLLSNSLKPQFIPIELGLGSSVISRSIQQISGITSAAMKKLHTTTGDPGDVAFAAKSNLRTLIPHPPLTIPYVYESLLKIAGCKGSGAAKEKQKIVEKLLLAASGEEVRYLTRTLCQNLRVGAVRTTILTALARAVIFTPPLGKPSPIHPSLLDFLTPPASPSKGKAKDMEKERLSAILQPAESLLKQVYAKHPNFDQIIPALLENGMEGLAERVPLAVGIPVLPMLGSPTRSLEEIYRRLGDLPFTAEFKYDGQRAQIHAYKSENKEPLVKIFSRHLEDMTGKYPDVIALVKPMMEEFNISSFIMDAEVVAIDSVTGALKSFQELSNRARKDVNIHDVKISVCIFAFDLMYLNDQSLLGRTFRDRRELLRSTFKSKHPGNDSFMAHFDFVNSCESEEGQSRIEEFMNEAVESKCEGLMLKLLDKAPVEEEPATKKSKLKSLPSTYEPDIRTSAWLKLKKDYMEGLGDSLDLIPIGAWHGNGRKAQWWSPVLLGLWNHDTGRPVAVCKCMSGFTDVFYKSMREKYDPGNEDCSQKPLWQCDFGGFKPNVYFRPHEVWEIRGADITESPVSVAAQGLVSSTRGLSLRFPRFIKKREDKGIENASNPAFLVGMWRNQQREAKDGLGEDDGELVDVDVLSDSNVGSEEEDSDI